MTYSAWRETLKHEFRRWLDDWIYRRFDGKRGALASGGSVSDAERR